MEIERKKRRERKNGGKSIARWRKKTGLKGRKRKRNGSGRDAAGGVGATGSEKYRQKYRQLWI
jgi:hypothetical protein